MAYSQESEFDNHHEEDISTFATGASIRLVGKVFGMGLQYLAAILVARILGVSDYGLYMLGITIISFAAILSRFGLDNAAVKYVSVYDGVGDKPGVRNIIYRILGYALIACTLISFTLYFAASPVSQIFFGKPDLYSVLRLLALSVPFLAIMAICSSLTQGYKKVSYTVYCQNVVQPISYLILISLFYYIGMRLDGVLFAWFGSSVLTLLVAVIFLVKAYRASSPHKTARPPRMEAASKVSLLRFSSSLLLITLMTSLIVWVDTIMVGYFCATDQVGIYIAASKTAMLTGFVLVSFSTIFSPIIADLYNKDEMQRLESIFKFASRWIFTLTLPLFLLLLLFAKDVMAVFGTDFTAGWKVLSIISVSYFINASAGPVGLVLIMTGHQKIMMYNSIVVFAMNVTANYLLIPVYGAVGAAYASALSIVSYNLLMLVQVFILQQIHPYDKKFLKPLVVGILGAVVLYFAVQAMPSTPFVRLAVYSPLFLTVFICLVLVTGLDIEDRVVLIQIKSKLQNYKRTK